MELYLLRHGIAVDKGTAGFSRDSDRPLTDQGIEKMYRIAKAMKSLELTFDLILSSPFVRAKQTAEIVAEVLGLGRALRFSANLAVGGDPEMLVKEIKPENSERILLVGHEPYLSTMVSVLVSGHDGLSINMKKGGLCKLTMNSLRFGQCATLEWLVGPRQIVSDG